jgi:chemotaxis protein CheD
MKDWLDARPIGMGEFGVAVEGRLAVRGLGSCVAVILHDASTRVGGIAHVMLPSHTLARNQAKPAKFADTAIPLLLEEMQRAGARRGNLRVRLVGGAKMFETVGPDGTMHMGERNLVACRTAVAEAGLTVAAEDVGGQRGRSILFDVGGGMVTVRTLGGGERHV